MDTAGGLQLANMAANACTGPCVSEVFSRTEHLGRGDVTGGHLGAGAPEASPPGFSTPGGKPADGHGGLHNRLPQYPRDNTTQRLGPLGPGAAIISSPSGIEHEASLALHYTAPTSGQPRGTWGTVTTAMAMVKGPAVASKGSSMAAILQQQYTEFSQDAAMSPEDLLELSRVVAMMQSPEPAMAQRPEWEEPLRMREESHSTPPGAQAQQLVGSQAVEQLQRAGASSAGCATQASWGVLSPASTPTKGAWLLQDQAPCFELLDQHPPPLGIGQASSMTVAAPFGAGYHYQDDDSDMERFVGTLGDCDIDGLFGEADELPAAWAMGVEDPAAVCGGVAPMDQAALAESALAAAMAAAAAVVLQASPLPQAGAGAQAQQPYLAGAGAPRQRQPCGAMKQRPLGVKKLPMKVQPAQVPADKDCQITIKLGINGKKGLPFYMGRAKDPVTRSAARVLGGLVLRQMQREVHGGTRVLEPSDPALMLRSLTLQLGDVGHRVFYSGLRDGDNEQAEEEYKQQAKEYKQLLEGYHSSHIAGEQEHQAWLQQHRPALDALLLKIHAAWRPPNSFYASLDELRAAVVHQVLAKASK